MIRVRNPWWIVGACVFGLVCSGGPINIWTFSVFLVPVADSLHIERSVIAGALAAAGPVGAICGPFVGALLDRFGARRVILTGIVLFALATAAQSLMTAWVAGIYLLFMARALGAVCQTPPAYAFVVTRWFDRNRGLALGIALSGVGLGTAVIPKIAAFLIEHFDWQQAYIGVAVVILILAGLPVLLFVREPDATERARIPHLSDATLPGVSLREALTGSWRFWALALAFFLGIIVLNGTLTMVVPMLKDRGVRLEAATTVLAYTGLAAIAGRILSGWLLDRIHGVFVAIGFFVALMIGTALLISGWGKPTLIVGAIICGVANGAEVDMMGFFVSRYFGLRYYGRIMGTMFAIFVASTGVGPLLSTRSFDVYHSYVPAFTFFEVILVVAIVIFSLLGPYPYPALKRHAPSAREHELPA
jgi:MFS family permease